MQGTKQYNIEDKISQIKETLAKLGSSLQISQDFQQTGMTSLGNTQPLEKYLEDQFKENQEVNELQEFSLGQQSADFPPIQINQKDNYVSEYVAKGILSEKYSPDKYSPEKYTPEKYSPEKYQSEKFSNENLPSEQNLSVKNQGSILATKISPRYEQAIQSMENIESNSFKGLKEK